VGTELWQGCLQQGLVQIAGLPLVELEVLPIEFCALKQRHSLRQELLQPLLESLLEDGQRLLYNSGRFGDGSNPQKFQTQHQPKSRIAFLTFVQELELALLGKGK